MCRRSRVVCSRVPPGRAGYTAVARQAAWERTSARTLPHRLLHMPVADLHRFGQGLADRLAVGAGAVPADVLGPGMLAQPRDQSRRCTWVRATAAGRDRLRAHVAALHQIADRAEQAAATNRPDSDADTGAGPDADTQRPHTG